MDDDVLALRSNDSFCFCIEAVQVKLMRWRNPGKSTNDLALVYLRASAISSRESDQQPDFHA